MPRQPDIFSCHNVSRGELSTSDTLAGGLLAAMTHLTDGESVPVTLCEDGEPVAMFTWMKVGQGELVRAVIAERKEMS
jgi:hypothetical protein